MKRILTALTNCILILTLPAWGGFALSYCIILDLLNESYRRDKIISVITGDRFFWKD